MNLPQEFLSSLQNLPGFDLASFSNVHAREQVLVSVRLNPAKVSETQLKEHFLQLKDAHGAPVLLHKIPWATHGYYLSGRPSFTLDPWFHAGCYYVQEASSMLIEQAIRQCVPISESLKVLDLCAAPGGKSTLIQTLIKEQSLLVANEVIKSRANILEENVTKWGASNVIVTNNDPKDFQSLSDYFDLMVVDAPCSGSGLFRRDPDAITEWSLNNVQLCSQRQQRILSDILPALKENGILIYSTCSYSKEEDEQIMDWLVDEMGMESIALEMSTDWGVVYTQGDSRTHGYRCWPDQVQGEGFFLSCFKKRSSNECIAPPKLKKTSLETASKQELASIESWWGPLTQFKIYKQESYFFCLSPHFTEDLLRFQQAKLYIKKAGILLGKLAGKDFIPEHALSLSQLESGSILAVEMEKEVALHYLRREEVGVEELKVTQGMQIKTGWAFVQYKGIRLGWIKVLPQRINNYYPKEWRILKKENN